MTSGGPLRLPIKRTSPVSKWIATNFPSSQAQKSCLARESRSRPWGPLEGIAKVSRISEGWLASIPTMSGWIRDIHVERGLDLVVNGPARAPRKDHGAGHGLLVHVD